MNARLQALNLDEFTGGLQTFGSQFNIAPNQSPDMLNIEIDPRGGFRTRKGWARWNSADAINVTTITTPYTIADAPALDIAGDLEIVVRVALDDWTSGAHQTFVAKASTPFADTEGYLFSLNDTGVLRVTVGDGVAARSSTSSVAPTVVDGTTYWFKVTYRLTNGSTREVKFYQAPDQEDEPTTWTQIGTTSTLSAVTSVAPNALPLVIGAESDGGAPIVGSMYRAIVRDGIGGTEVVDLSPEIWEPRHSFVHFLSTGAYVIYVTNSNRIEAATGSAVFSTLQVTGPTDVVATASPHLADFAAWGDTAYIACGITNPTIRRTTTGTPAAATDAYGNYNDDYTTPDAIGSGVMPKCEFIETHSGYVFAAYTAEATTEPNRLRWSHPSQPENWATDDYIDIKAGGGKITGLRSFQDHLLIFKTDSVWALYGYDSESWQLVRVSSTAGSPNISAITASEGAVYFYSSALGGGIYAYAGGQQPISIAENLRTVTDEIISHTDVWLAWAGRRLWCSLPWTVGGAVNDQSTVFVFDPQVGSGAWVAHRSAIGHVKCIVEDAEGRTGSALAAICGCSGAAALVELESRDEASDVIRLDLTPSPFDAYYVTSWQHAGWPERRKSWRRPRFVVDQPIEDVAIDMETYFNYDEGAPLRSHTIWVNSEGTAFWRETGALEEGGFDWGDGTLWGASGASGSEIVRAPGNTVTLGGLGVNRSIQLRFSTNAEYLGKAWGVNLITLKYILRRLTT